MPAASSAVTSSFTPRYIPRNITRLSPPQLKFQTLQVGADRRRGLRLHGAELTHQALADALDELRLSGTERRGALAQHAQREARVAGHSTAGVGKEELLAVDAIAS